MKLLIEVLFFVHFVIWVEKLCAFVVEKLETNYMFSYEQFKAYMICVIK